MRFTGQEDEMEDRTMASEEQLPTRHRMFQAASGEVNNAMDGLDAATGWLRRTGNRSVPA